MIDNYLLVFTIMLMILSFFVNFLPEDAANSLGNVNNYLIDRSIKYNARDCLSISCLWLFCLISLFPWRTTFIAVLHVNAAPT